MIADFKLGVVDEPVGAAAAFNRSMSANDSPAPNAPMRRKFRRLIPSQNVWRFPRNVIIEGSPQGRKAGKLGGSRANHIGSCLILIWHS